MSVVSIDFGCPYCGSRPEEGGSIGEPEYGPQRRTLRMEVHCPKGHVYRFSGRPIERCGDRLPRAMRQAHYARLGAELREISEQTRDPWVARVTARAAEIAPRLGEEGDD